MRETWCWPGGRAERAGSLAVAFLAVHPAEGALRISGRPGDAIAFAKPLEQVAVLASAAAERRVRGMRRLAA